MFHGKVLGMQFPTRSPSLLLRGEGIGMKCECKVYFHQDDIEYRCAGQYYTVHVMVLADGVQDESLKSYKSLVLRLKIRLTP